MREHDSELRAQDEDDDLIAVRDTLHGDIEAFGRIVDRYTPVVYSLAYRYLSSPEDAEDAVQDIFARVYEALKRFRLDKRFYPWMYTIAVNYLRSVRTRRMRRADESTLPYEDRISGDDASRPELRPERELEQRETERIVQDAIASLPPKYRRIVILRQIQELSVLEVSEVLDLPEGTVKTHLHRARKMLVDRITAAGETAAEQDRI